MVVHMVSSSAAFPSSSSWITIKLFSYIYVHIALATVISIKIIWLEIKQTWDVLQSLAIVIREERKENDWMLSRLV